MSEAGQRGHSMPTQSPGTSCAVHGLQVGPQGLCVLCKRSTATLEATTQNADTSAATSARVGMLITGGALLLMIGIGALLWSRHDAPIAAPGSVVAVELAAVPAPDPNLAKLAKADFWNKQDTTIVTDAQHASAHASGNTAAPSPMPAPSESAVPALAVNASPATSPEEETRLREEAERDRLRHEAIERDIAQRASRQALTHEQALIAEARGKVAIEMWSAAWCKNCRNAEAYLAATRTRYRGHDIDRETGARAAMHRINPRHSVPTFTLDDEVVVGFSQSRFEQALDRAARKRLGLPL